MFYKYVEIICAQEIRFIKICSHDSIYNWREYIHILIYICAVVFFQAHFCGYRARELIQLNLEILSEFIGINIIQWYIYIALLRI